MRRKRKWGREDDPAAGLLNLFDIWLVFAVSLLLAALTCSLATRPSDATPVKNPGEPENLKNDGSLARRVGPIK